MKNRYIVTAPKTYSSKRKIYIQDELLPLAKELKKGALANKLVCGRDFLFLQKITLSIPRHIAFI